ncbi:MAG: DUF1330 domain-containing protein [SAR86 cluster bacterium]|jgi:uncharacterized protein (DUF1330 family)|uniref:DUF1330 domain-containing protein n=1 Tax=SAR86 cluster bacterium TaxID=2030880 RepID=A0A520N0W7_9GAMM|nr:MAG: DUF1330 domain-containing protein [Gammaproteobacteria bacterium TMED225]RZO27121.1 MAG: DUF1330 domain-containing protein [SAR86 cluster bacterium]|tara:strand:- start:4090 stop:4491 length:402 start_codon:yes stop_codon:yes gene_type:complete
MKVENKITPSEEQINGFLEDPNVGPISMVNLLKYKDKADYTDGRDVNLSGKEAYMLYATEVINLITKYGGEFIFAGKVNRLMLGEVDEMWDEIAIAKYPSRKAMFEMTMDPEYQKIHIHRDAGLKGQLNIETI